MNELRPKKKNVLDAIDENEYVKSQTDDQITYSFYLRFAQRNFKPCPECQDELHRIIEKAEDLYFGNKAYEPAIELHRFWETDDYHWEDIERRTATEKDYIVVYGNEKGPRYWKEYKELDEES